MSRAKESTSRSLLTLAAGRRAKWIVLAVALVVVAVAGSFAGKFEDVQKNDPASFLPGSAESVQVLQQAKRFPSGEVTPAVVVYRRESGLTAADRARVQRDRAAIAARPPKGAERITPVVPSPDRKAALFAVPIRGGGDSDLLVDGVDSIRSRVGRGGGGLEVATTGPAGYSADAIKVFQQINGTLLVATAALVFFLLIVIYRSPIFWAIPLFSVIMAEATSRGLGYAIAEAGVTVNGQSAGILPVLVFGAGTDYALLLVARYREELRHHEDKHEAMRVALGRAGPAIVASGLTVIAALLCLSIAEVNGTAGLGPIGAMGVGLAMVSMLTVLPALLVICGRRAFWPFVPRFGAEGADETHGAWRKVAERVAAAPARVAAGSAALLLFLCLGLTYLNTDLTSGQGFRESVEAVKGQQLISSSYPAGSNAPTSVLVRDRARVRAVQAALARAPGVARVGPPETGPPGARFDITLEQAPYSSGAFERIPALRKVAKAAGGDSTLIGGPTAEERDLRTSAERDNIVIPPVTLLVVFFILALLLRALVAPLILIGTVILSYGAALGTSMFMFDKVFGFAGADPGIPLFCFIFLVALGVDYNIFLMVRVREEAQKHGTRLGTIRGLAVTGAVITSAGIVLAGTFAILGVLPLVTLTEIGFTIAFGVLLDTFVVRSILVPSLVLLVGPRVWWPSALARERERELEPVA